MMKLYILKCNVYLIMIFCVLILCNYSCKNEKLKTNNINITSDINVDFDISALEKVILNPEEILTNGIDSFWLNNDAYYLSKIWHEYERFPIDFNAWTGKLEKYCEIPIKERQNNEFLSFARNILNEETDFQNIAVPHILSFLPKNTPEINTNVYFIEETRTGGFVENGQIVIDITNKVNCNSGFLLNTIIHELFHIGYADHRLRRTEIELDDMRLTRMLDLLQNEGIATYVSFKALSVYNMKNLKKDYILLESDAAINNLRNSLNKLLTQAKSLNQTEFYNLEDNIGYDQRAYYVFGAYMAKTIDEKLGRDSLINTISTGPRSFISTYNSIAEDNMKIIEFKLPKNIAASQLLKRAYINSDNQKISSIEKELLNNKNTLNKKDESNINLLGYYLMLENRKEDAIRVMKLNTELFPESSNAYDSLGEAYMEAGKNELAIESFSKSLELNPNNKNAEENLIKLQRL